MHSCFRIVHQRYDVGCASNGLNGVAAYLIGRSWNQKSFTGTLLCRKTNVRQKFLVLYLYMCGRYTTYNWAIQGRDWRSSVKSFVLPVGFLSMKGWLSIHCSFLKSNPSDDSLLPISVGLLASVLVATQEPIFSIYSKDILCNLW